MSDTAASADVAGQVEHIQAALAARADPTYEWGMRRTVPSEQPAHAVRVPDIRAVATGWLKERRQEPVEDVMTVAEALWGTGWREERIVAVVMLSRSLRRIDASAAWSIAERWSADIDNWEHVDHLAGATGALLNAEPGLLKAVHGLEASDNPWQRRLAVVTLIEAARGGRWRPELESLADRRQRDAHPLVRKAVVWARRELRQRGAGSA